MSETAGGSTSLFSVIDWVVVAVATGLLYAMNAVAVHDENLAHLTPILCVAVWAWYLLLNVQFLQLLHSMPGKAHWTVLTTPVLSILAVLNPALAFELLFDVKTHFGLSALVLVCLSVGMTWALMPRLVRAYSAAGVRRIPGDAILFFRYPPESIGDAAPYCAALAAIQFLPMLALFT